MDIPPIQETELHQTIPQKQSNVPRFYQDDHSSEVLTDDIVKLNKVGVELGKQGKFELSLSALNRGILLNDQIPETYYNRGYIYSCLGNFQQAIEDYTSAIKIDPNFGPAYNDRALAYEAQGQFAKAIDDYEYSLRLRPGHSYTLRNLAMAYYHVGRLQDAERTLQAVLKEDPKPIKALVLLGLLQQAKGDNEQAKKTWNEAKASPLPLELTLETSGQYYWHAAAAYYRGEYELAHQLVVKAMQFRPDTLSIYPASLLKLKEYSKTQEDCMQKK